MILKYSHEKAVGVQKRHANFLGMQTLVIERWNSSGPQKPENGKTDLILYNEQRTPNSWQLSEILMETVTANEVRFFILLCFALGDHTWQFSEVISCLCAGVTFGWLMGPYRVSGIKIGWLCASQTSYTLYYVSSPSDFLKMNTSQMDGPHSFTSYTWPFLMHFNGQS